MMNAECRRQKAELALGALLLSAFCFLLSCAERSRDSRETLEFWGLGREGEVVAEMIPEFERRNPGIHVVFQQIPWTAAHEKLLTAFVGESVPDVAQMGNTWVPEFAAMNGFEDLGPFARASLDRSDYFDGIWDTNVVGGVLYGVPWYVDTRVLFYRSDLLGSVGYPKGPRTWAEWMDCMERLQREHKSRFGIIMPTNEWEPIVQLALTNRSTLLDAQGAHGAFEQPAFRDAFDFYVTMFRRGFAPKASDVQVANLWQQFGRGDFTMYITGPWNVAEFRRRLPELKGRWATAPLPARDANTPGVSMAGGASLVLFRGTRHKDAALKLIAFLSEPAQQVRFYELTGDLPARRSAWAAPSLANDPYFPAFRQQLEHVQSLPKVPEWQEIAMDLANIGEATVRGAMSEPQALAALDHRADVLLEKRRWMLAQAEKR
jgi:multiple sugar transport system substrate-binding protein